MSADDNCRRCGCMGFIRVPRESVILTYVLTHARIQNDSDPNARNNCYCGHPLTLHAPLAMLESRMCVPPAPEARFDTDDSNPTGGSICIRCGQPFFLHRRNTNAQAPVEGHSSSSISSSQALLAPTDGSSTVFHHWNPPRPQNLVQETTNARRVSARLRTNINQQQRQNAGIGTVPPSVAPSPYSMGPTVRMNTTPQTVSSGNNRGTRGRGGPSSTSTSTHTFDIILVPRPDYEQFPNTEEGKAEIRWPPELKQPPLIEQANGLGLKFRVRLTLTDKELISPHLERELLHHLTVANLQFETHRRTAMPLLPTQQRWTYLLPIRNNKFPALEWIHNPEAMTTKDLVKKLKPISKLGPLPAGDGIPAGTVPILVFIAARNCFIVSKRGRETHYCLTQRLLNGFSTADCEEPKRDVQCWETCSIDEEDPLFLPDEDTETETEVPTPNATDVFPTPFQATTPAISPAPPTIIPINSMPLQATAPLAMNLAPTVTRPSIPTAAPFQDAAPFVQSAPPTAVLQTPIPTLTSAATTTSVPLPTQLTTSFRMPNANPLSVLTETSTPAQTPPYSPNMPAVSSLIPYEFLDLEAITNDSGRRRTSVVSWKAWVDRLQMLFDRDFLDDDTVQLKLTSTSPSPEFYNYVWSVIVSIGNGEDPALVQRPNEVIECNLDVKTIHCGPDDRIFTVGEGVGDGIGRDLWYKLNHILSSGQNSGYWMEVMSTEYKTPVLRRPGFSVPETELRFWRGVGCFIRISLIWGMELPDLSPFLQLLLLLKTDNAMGAVCDREFVSGVASALSNRLDTWPPNSGDDLVDGQDPMNLVYAHLDNVLRPHLVSMTKEERDQLTFEIRSKAIFGPFAPSMLSQNAVFSAIRQGFDLAKVPGTYTKLSDTFAHAADALGSEPTRIIGELHNGRHLETTQDILSRLEWEHSEGHRFYTAERRWMSWLVRYLQGGQGLERCRRFMKSMYGGKLLPPSVFTTLKIRFTTTLPDHNAFSSHICLYMMDIQIDEDIRSLVSQPMPDNVHEICEMDENFDIIFSDQDTEFNSF
ncbi:hypothetical protein K435DRAFT_847058 [Dendrothele bispora CBS 962.96]|uniref:HECT domain-containing protein n=1 Tax=Dendrothele bispora (strain CBS 962.96) TaxID=1314807 RepID=A0A4S8N003_DENBC|nr:hypothetical protein K435DRAFT_847058 [Dendrothele bispora CBS 962.96]